MPIYTEKIKDKEGNLIDKLVDGKKQYYIRTYIEDEFGNRKQITRHNKEWLGRDGYWEAQREENVIKCKPIKKEKLKKITLRQLRDLYIEHIRGTIDDDTILWKLSALNHFCEFDSSNQVTTYPNLPIERLNKDIYIQWQKQMKNKTYFRGKKEYHYTIKYLNKVHQEICRMLDFAVLEGYCQTNVARQCGKIGTSKEIKMENAEKHYETIDFNQFLSLMESSKDNLKYNTYFELEFTRGPRMGEVRALRVKDFSIEKKQLMINHTMSKKNKLKPPKTSASKAPIDLSDSLVNKIQALIDKMKEMDGFDDEWYIFNGPTPISANALENAKQKYFRLANINKHIRNHDFRHSCATWLHSIGVPITVISKILRHASINETMKTYTHLFENDYQRYLIEINNYTKQDQKQDQNILLNKKAF